MGMDDNKKQFSNEIIELCNERKDKGVKWMEIVEIRKKYGVGKKTARRILDAITITGGYGLYFSNYQYLRQNEDRRIMNMKNKKILDKEKYSIEQDNYFSQFPTKKDFDNIVYRFIDANGEIIYVGKAENLLNRLNGHKHLPDECYHRVARLEYCKFDSYDDLYLAEPYFIAKWKPEYNQDYKNRNYSFSIAELENREWKEFNQGVKILKHKHSQAA